MAQCSSSVNVSVVDEHVLRRRYAAALRAGRMGTFEFDVATGDVFWDEALEHLFGVEPSPGPRSMSDYADRVHPEDVAASRERVVACLSGSIPGFDAEYRMIRADGEVFWVRTSVVRLDPPEGGVRLVGVCADVTDRHRAEEARAAATEAARAARQAAEVSQRRLQMLAQVASLLEAPPDLPSTLQRVAELAVAELADWCSVGLEDESGYHRVAIAHRDPAMLRRAEEVERRWPSRADEPLRVAVRQTRQPVHLPVIDDALLVQSAQDEEHFTALREFSMSSAALVPVQAGGVGLGVLTLVSTHGRTIDAETVELAVELGRRAGTAVERVRWQAERDRVSTALQRALLPPALPTVPGVELAAAYEPAGSGAAVGGDFYDVVTTGGDRWWVVLGDVQGKGPEAAAVTGTIRHVLRTVIHDTADPAEALQRAQAALERQSLDERTASVVLATFLTGTDELVVHLASAGHPPALLRAAADGGPRVRAIDASGVLLGVGADVGAQTTSIPLAAGDVLLLYTDGATDAPLGVHGRLEEEGLQALVAAAAAKPAAVVDAVLLGVQGSAGARRDDIALLALGRQPTWQAAARA